MVLHFSEGGEMARVEGVKVKKSKQVELDWE